MSTPGFFNLAQCSQVSGSFMYNMIEFLLQSKRYALLIETIFTLLYFCFVLFGVFFCSLFCGGLFALLFFVFLVFFFNRVFLYSLEPS